MGRFDDFNRMIVEMFNDFGFVTTYHKTTTTPNDLTGTVDAVTEEIEISAIRMELIQPTNGVGTKGGTLIQDGDLALYVMPVEKASKFEEAISINTTLDRISINGVMWKIVTVKSHDPSGSDCILYEMYIRK